MLEFHYCFFVFGGTHMKQNSLTLHRPVSVVSCASLFSWLVDGAHLPCLAVKMLSGERSLLMWGGSICCYPLGPTVNLWTMGTACQQFLLSVHYGNIICHCQCHCHSEQKCLLLMNLHQESDSNTSSMMFGSVRFLLVAILLNALWHNSVHNKPNTSTLIMIQASALPGLSHVIALP
jgi:hypothetical protein